MQTPSLASTSSETNTSLPSLLKEIRELVSPLKEKKVSLSSYLQTVLKRKTEDNSDVWASTTDIKWNFVEHCLQLLERATQCVQLEVRLQKTQTSVPTKKITNIDDHIPETQPTVLSLQELSLLKTLLDIVVVWGMTPCIDEGIGVSLFKRSRQLQQLSSVENSDVKVTSKDVRKHRLRTCVRSLLLLADEKTELLPVIASRYLMDLLASLLQLKHLTMDTNKESSSSNGTTFSQYASPASLVTVAFGHSTTELQYCIDTLNHIMESFLPKYIVESLTLLMAVQNCPIWLKKECGILLTRCLLKPHGLFVILDHMLDDTNKEVSVQLYERVVQLVTSVPQQVASKEEYYMLICPQVLELLNAGGIQTDHIIKVAIRLVVKMVQKEPKLTAKYFFNDLFNPVLWLSGSDVDESSSDTLANEGEVQRCVENIHKLATTQVADQSFWTAIATVIPSLFRLYCFCAQSKSNLKTICKDILLAFLRLSDHASEVLKATIIPTEVRRDRAICTLGPTGGVAIKVASEDVARDYASEAELLIELLKENNDDSLTGNLFVELLNLFIKLKMEAVADERHLALLQLLALMSDTIGPSVLRDVVQVCTLLKVLLVDFTDEETLTVCLGLIITLASGAVAIKKEEEFLFD